MGNTDGIKEAVASHGNNKVINFNGGHFSFAFGNEIAFIVDDKYWILNCDYHLWKIVKIAVKKTKDKEKLAKWWKKQSDDYKVSVWSDEFNLIK